MLKQCLTLLMHSKTVVNTVWLKSEAIQPFFCNHMKCLQNSPKCNSNLWHPWELISLSNALWAVSKSSRALWADISLERGLSCEQEFKSLVIWSLSRTRSEQELKEPCEPISLSLERALSCEQEVKSLVSWSLSRTRCEQEFKSLVSRSLSLERALSCEQEFKSLVSWSLSLERAVSCEQEVKSLVSWSLSLERAVSKSSRALWADLSLSLERALSCEQEFKSLVTWSLSRTRSKLWARVQEPFEPSLSLACELWAERLAHKILARLAPTVQRCSTFCYSGKCKWQIILENNWDELQAQQCI